MISIETATNINEIKSIIFGHGIKNNKLGNMWIEAEGIQNIAKWND